MTDRIINDILFAMQGGYCENPYGELLPDVYAPGSPCDKLYEAAFNARLRIYKRTGWRELNDPDVEEMYESLLSLVDEMSRIVFRTAWRLAKENAATIEDLEHVKEISHPDNLKYIEQERFFKSLEGKPNVIPFRPPNSDL